MFLLAACESACARLCVRYVPHPGEPRKGCDYFVYMGFTIREKLQEHHAKSAGPRHAGAKKAERAWT